MTETLLTTTELLDLAWNLYDIVENKGDHVLESLLIDVEKEHGEKVRSQIEYLLEVECNIADLWVKKNLPERGGFFVYAKQKS